jgi:uncharacterized XkdX family phage protein
MNYFDRIKYYYDNGYWTKEQVAIAIKYGKITEAEYEQIVGESYSAT